ncbi:hypothetical protein C4K11_2447 [Pseudomonas chlororaphis subsp. aureofaciens]|nr:hypothetical protein C4K12_2513 [Pseudomonas chlororaphis subsp. aureofaciens]AZE04609.1 hypothetical protein C4K11_2447 [Pseudomonas chlororaphis subsp. aureofaciens]
MGLNFLSRGFICPLPGASTSWMAIRRGCFFSLRPVSIFLLPRYLP